jgi:hypothetical protein
MKTETGRTGPSRRDASPDEGQTLVVVAIVLAASASTAAAQSSGGSALWGSGMTGSFAYPSYYPPRHLNASDVRRRRAAGRPAPARPYCPTTAPHRGSFFAGGNR